MRALQIEYFMVVIVEYSDMVILTRYFDSVCFSFLDFTNFSKDFFLLTKTRPAFNLKQKFIQFHVVTF